MVSPGVAPVDASSKSIPVSVGGLEGTRRAIVVELIIFSLLNSIATGAIAVIFIITRPASRVSPGASVEDQCL